MITVKLTIYNTEAGFTLTLNDVVNGKFTEKTERRISGIKLLGNEPKIFSRVISIPETSAIISHESNQKDLKDKP